MRRGPKPGQHPENLAKKLTCGKCRFAWLYDGADGIVTHCPLCGHKKDARNRKVKMKGYGADRPERLQRLTGWLKENKQRHSQETADRTKRTVFAVISKSLHPCCTGCGCDDVRLLEVNHKNGGGGKEIQYYKNSQAFYRDIAMLRRPVDDLELLCRVCNAKHYLELKYGPLPLEVRWTSSPIISMVE